MGRVHILLKQHVGVPCKAVTEPGADVQRGTLIAVPDGLGANIFSSVCGVVESVTDTEIVIRKERRLRWWPMLVSPEWAARDFRQQ